MRRIGFGTLVAAVTIAGGVALGLGDTTVAEGRTVKTARVLAQSDQVASGQQLYARMCAMCHGDSGEGIDDAPPLMGPRTQLADYRTAARAYSFISSEMPQDEPGSLSSQQYYDILAYILDQNGMNPSGEPVNQSTAANISLAP